MSAWFCINNKLDESTYRPKKFKNVERGQMYEKAALDNFTGVSGGKCTTRKIHMKPHLGPSGIFSISSLVRISMISLISNLSHKLYFN